MAIAIPVGIISAVKSRSLLDRTTMITTLAFISAPVFWLGLVALYLFARQHARDIDRTIRAARHAVAPAAPMLLSLRPSRASVVLVASASASSSHS